MKAASQREGEGERTNEPLSPPVSRDTEYKGGLF